MNRYPAIGASDEPTEATRFDSTAWAARVFGVRTMVALAAARERGTKLGGDRCVKPTVNMRIQSAAARQQAAAKRAADLSGTIAELRASGATSLRALATKLNEIGIPTTRGSGTWSAVQVQRVLERLEA